MAALSQPVALQLCSASIGRSIICMLFVAAICVLQGCEVEVAEAGSNPVGSDPGDSTGDTPTSSPGESNCLCVFDIDRTLTACHDCESECPGVRKINGVKDNGYGYGTLILSQMTNNWESTKCANQCYVGLVSAGDANGQNSDMRAFIIDNVYKKATHHIDGAGHHWFKHGWDSGRAPFWTGVPEGQKQHAIRKVVDWYKEEHHVKIDDDKVYFFDDKENNIKGAEGTFVVKYVSEHSRDGSHGRCGATVDEVDSCWVNVANGRCR